MNLTSAGIDELTWHANAITGLGDLKSASAGANKSFMKDLSYSIITTLVFDHLNVLDNSSGTLRCLTHKLAHPQTSITEIPYPQT